MVVVIKLKFGIGPLKLEHEDIFLPFFISNIEFKILKVYMIDIKKV